MKTIDSETVLARYKNRIIDLSRRNRLLNFPKNAKSIVFDMSFDKFLSKFGNLNAFSIEFSHQAIEQEEHDLAQEALDNLSTIPKEKRQPKEYLPPTHLRGKKLLTVLSGLRLDAKKSFDEYGLHTLFLAIGKVKWHEPSVGKLNSGDGNSEYAFSAPLLLVPIQIAEQRDTKKKTVISTDSQMEIRLNTALELLLENEYKARKPVFDLNAVVDWSLFLKDLCKQMHSIFSELGLKFEIVQDIQIAQYSFLNEQLYQDLHANAKELMEHEFINAMCTHTPITQKQLASAKDDHCDDLLTKNNDFNVLDADKSQLGVIQKALNGAHLVVQGPPGTGKSQTIVNLIANLLAREKTVLFVCEKQIALQVVFNRLKEQGLDKLCLFLSNAKADKKSFVKQILQDRDTVIAEALDNDKLKKTENMLLSREDHINKLRTYAQKLGQIAHPFGKSAQWVHGELAKHRRVAHDNMLPWQGESVLDITFDYYNQVLNLLHSKSYLFNSRLSDALVHWRDVNVSAMSIDLHERIAQCLNGIKSALTDMFKVKPVYVHFDTLADIRQIIAIQKLDMPEHVDALLNLDVELSQAAAVLYSLLPNLEECRVKQRQLLEMYRVSQLHMDKLQVPPIAYITDETRISQITHAYNDGPVLLEHILAVTTMLKNIRSGSFSFAELFQCKAILTIDPSVKNIQNWQSLQVLTAASEQLRHIYQLHTTVLKCERDLHVWEIEADTVDKRRILGIGKRFKTTYATFLRYFYRQYYKDSAYIKSLCLSSDDAIDSAEVAMTLHDYYAQRELLVGTLHNFNQTYMGDAPISVDRVYQLQKNVQALASWLAKSAIKTIPEKIERLFDSASDTVSIQKIYEHVDKIQLVLGSSWNWLGFRDMPLDECFDTIQQRYTLLMHELSAVIQFFEGINACRINPHVDISFIALKKESSVVQELRDNINKLYDAQAEYIFADKQRFIYAFENILKLPMLVEKFVSLHEIMLLKRHTFSDVITLKQALAYLDELQKHSMVFESNIATYQTNVDRLKGLFCNETALNSLEAIACEQFVANIDVMLHDKDGLKTWIEYYRYNRQLVEHGLAWYLDATEHREIAEPVSVFARSFLTAWLESYHQQHPELLYFNRKDHEHTIRLFKDLEKSVLKSNALRLLHMYADDFKRTRNLGGKSETFLVHQSQLKMRHQTIRNVVQEAGQRIADYKPCWMVSPVALSSHVPYNGLNFDVVIFDEASQMRVEYALGAIARAKQVIILGDENQLPPSAFFNTAIEEEDDGHMSQDYESVLQATKEVLPGAELMLTYHYRSKYENLIAFSNHYIYQDRLITFPNAGSSDQAVQFEYVSDGLFDGGSGGSRSNTIEARRVVELCIEHAQQHPESSLGVIAFSKTHEGAIRNALQEALKEQLDPNIALFLDETKNDTGVFFIKNLESVQGDERDAIILSVGYGRDKRTGEMYNRFGPINGQYGYRRLNVAITRAKEKIICVSSIKATDIRNTETRGAKLLSQYLEYAERGVQTLGASRLLQDRKGIDADSPFEEEVERALQSRGYRINRQIGASGFKIDLAIVHPHNEAEYILGIECDGAAYHSSYSARMNDRIRQDILERLGWKIYRVWSQHWISNREEILDQITATVNSQIK